MRAPNQGVPSKINSEAIMSFSQMNPCRGEVLVYPGEEYFFPVAKAVCMGGSRQEFGPIVWSEAVSHRDGRDMQVMAVMQCGSQVPQNPRGVGADGFVR